MLELNSFWNRSCCIKHPSYDDLLMSVPPVLSSPSLSVSICSLVCILCSCMTFVRCSCLLQSMSLCAWRHSKWTSDAHVSTCLRLMSTSSVYLFIRVHALTFACRHADTLQETIYSHQFHECSAFMILQSIKHAFLHVRSYVCTRACGHFRVHVLFCTYEGLSMCICASCLVSVRVHVCIRFQPLSYCATSDTSSGCQASILPAHCRWGW